MPPPRVEQRRPPRDPRLLMLQTQAAALVTYTVLGAIFPNVAAWDRRRQRTLRGIALNVGWTFAFLALRMRVCSSTAARNASGRFAEPPSSCPSLGTRTSAASADRRPSRSTASHGSGHSGRRADAPRFSGELSAGLTEHRTSLA